MPLILVCLLIIGCFDLGIIFVREISTIPKWECHKTEIKQDVGAE